MTNKKKSLISSQIIIVLYLMFAAISAIETFAQYRSKGFSNPRVYLFAAVFIFCMVMYFIKKKQRFEKKD